MPKVPEEKDILAVFVNERSKVKGGKYRSRNFRINEARELSCFFPLFMELPEELLKLPINELLEHQEFWIKACEVSNNKLYAACTTTQEAVHSHPPLKVEFDNNPIGHANVSNWPVDQNDLIDLKDRISKLISLSIIENPFYSQAI